MLAYVAEYPIQLSVFDSGGYRICDWMDFTVVEKDPGKTDCTFHPVINLAASADSFLSYKGSIANLLSRPVYLPIQLDGLAVRLRWTGNCSAPDRQTPKTLTADRKFAILKQMLGVER